MTYNEYKQHLENCGPLGDIAKGLLSAFEIGYAQGLTEGGKQDVKRYPLWVVFDGVRPWSVYSNKDRAELEAEELQKTYSLSGVLSAFKVKQYQEVN